MKKSMTKLVLKREMIRTLDGMQLEGIRGGDAANSGNGAGCPPLMDSGNKDGCPRRADNKPTVGG